ncbi:hypothetical protein BGZ65_002930 [Modicella reniformis]|uniref:Uncharacterized protein n=1 Tax=Modicella reniformis TaxID=1440133 RepID=A0A9P6MII0_9FUNG|nr:hypothetical protein BGZ65_002930 [Modicella reniformis]
MSSLPEPSARHVLIFLFGIIFLQLFFRFHESKQTAFNHNPTDFNSQRTRLHHHPSVPLNLHGLDILDELTAHIIAVEAHRTFAESGLSDIHGTSIKNDTVGAKRIRDQIHCWTQHGSWVRQDEKSDKGALTSWSARKSHGDRRFGVCDTRFMEGLDRALGSPSNNDRHFLGEYDQKNGRWLVREAVKYRWVPDESICGPVAPIPNENTDTTPTTGLGDERSIYQLFDKEMFCEILAGRHLLVAGDTTQYQLYDSILSAVGSVSSCGDELNCRQSHQLCATSNVTFARNDFISVPWALDAIDDNNDYPSGLSIEQPWATTEMLQTYGIVLLNKGLIWKPDDKFLTELVFTMKHLWKFYPNVMILYRATPPVSNCTVLKEQREDETIAGDDGESIVPGLKIQRPLATTPERTRDSIDPARWFRPTLADVQRQNRMAKAIVESAGGIFLDTENMFAMRPDGRVGDGDCSLFCAPGPVDIYADLLFNTLRILPGPVQITELTKVEE